MTTVYLIRHAEAEGNLYRRAQGHHDGRITDRGYRQIAALMKRFEHISIDAVYSSDLSRTMTTSLAIRMPKNLPLKTMPQLREICIGVWEGQTWARIGHDDRQGLTNFNTDSVHWSAEGAESFADVRERMVAALHQIIAENEGKTVAIFSHGMALRILVGTLQGLTLSEIDKTGHAENTAVSKLEAKDDEIRVIYTNDASHLPEELTTLHRQSWTKNKNGIEEGIYYLSSGEDGHFDVMSGEETVGAVSVVPHANGVAEIEEYWLENDFQNRGYGIQLIGQALHYAREHGCETLRILIPRSNAVGCHCAEKWGFAPVEETAESVTYEKYFGYSEEYTRQKLQKVIGI